MKNEDDIEKLKAICSSLEDQVRLLVKTEIKLIRTQAELLESKKKVEEHSKTLEQKVEERTKELKISEKRFKDIAFSSADWIWEIDESYRFTYCSEKVKDILGYSREGIIGKDFFVFSSSGEAEKINQLFGDKAPIKDLENWTLTKDGKSVCLLTYAIPIVGDQGEFKGYRGINKDVTDRKKAEAAIQASEQRYRELTNMIPIGIFETNFNRRLVFANQTGYEWFGYSENEIDSRKISILQFIVAKDRQGAEQNFQHVLSSKIISSVEYEVQRKSGRTFPALITSCVILKENEVTGLRIIISDISESKHAEKLRLEKESAEAANRTKSEFLSHMSHEIRTPMNAIIGFSELLAATITDEEQQSKLNGILYSGKSLLKIINDILDLSKIEAGKLKFQLLPVNVHNIVKEVETIFSIKIKEKGLSFIIEEKNEIPSVLLLDEVRIRQVLFNIVGNAVKFTEKGYIKLILDKTIKPENAYKIGLQISIEDTGIGIPKDQHELIFEAFNQQLGQSTKKYGGTGLGLAITKRLVEMMGGKIMISSTPGKGSIFRITLPNIEVPAQDVCFINEPAFDPRSTIFEKSKILICDDNSLNRKLIIAALEYSPMTFFEAQNGKEAIEMAMQQHPDLIFLDLIMPEMNGYDAVRILKKNKITRNIPLIAISASSPINSKLKNNHQLFNDYLIKPIYLSDLYKSMKKFLNYDSIGKTNDSLKVPEFVSELSEEQKKQLPKLIQILTNEFIPLYNEVLQSRMIDKIRDFGKQLISLGSEYMVETIIHYGNKIVKYANNFDIEKLSEVLNEFPGLIENLKLVVKKGQYGSRKTI